MTITHQRTPVDIRRFETPHVEVAVLIFNGEKTYQVKLKCQIGNQMYNLHIQSDDLRECNEVARVVKSLVDDCEDGSVIPATLKAIFIWFTRDQFDTLNGYYDMTDLPK